MNDDDFIAAAKPIIKRGGTYIEVSKATGISKNMAAYHCRRVGLRSKNKCGRPMGTQGPRQFNYAEAARMRKTGATLSVIAEHFGVSKQAIHQAINKMNAGKTYKKGTQR